MQGPDDIKDKSAEKSTDCSEEPQATVATSYQPRREEQRGGDVAEPMGCVNAAEARRTRLCLVAAGTRGETTTIADAAERE